MVSNNQKLWKKYYNKTVKGEDYHIHHKDGDNSNNCKDNLELVTPEKHFYIHFENGEYYQCVLLSRFFKLKIPIEIIQEVCKLSGRKAGLIARDKKAGFHASSKEKKLLTAKLGGKKTFELQTGIFAKQYQTDSVGGTFWWSNTKTLKMVRRKIQPDGEDWIKGKLR